MSQMPDKIWINPLIDLPKLSGVIDKDSVQYVRTDAFIEDVCAELKKLMYDNLMFLGRLHREEVIDNFVEDFKNYVKGK